MVDSVCKTSFAKKSYIVLLSLFLFVSLTLGCWLRAKYNKEQAEIYTREQRTLFPFHFNVLVLFAVAQVLSSVLGIAAVYKKNCDGDLSSCDLTENYAGEDVNFAGALLLGLSFGVENALIEGTACLVLFSGIGKRTANLAMIGGAIWGAFVTVMIFLAYTASIVYGFIMHLLIIAFFGAMWLLPNRGILTRRPSSVFYGRFWTLYRIGLLVSVIVQLYSDVGACLQAIVLVIGIGMMKMLVVYRTFELEAVWWHGGHTYYDTRSARHILDSVSEMPSSSIETPLEGVQLSGNAAEAMISVRDQISAKVPMLNFAALRIFPSKMLGAGSTARVYEGRLREKKVRS